MDPKLLEVLKKAKAIDQRAKQFDSTDTATLESNVKSRIQGTNQNSGGMMTEQPISAPTMDSPISAPTMDSPISKPIQRVDVNSETYKQRVKESKLPPEVIQAMLDNPIQQPDAPGTFSMDEQAIKEINPNYGTQNLSQPTVLEDVRPKQNNYSIDENLMRKMISEEIAKALPSIVETYFDKKMIKENIEVLKAIKVRKKTNNKR